MICKNKFMTTSPSHSPRIQLNSPILPILAALCLVLALIDGYKGWLILLIALGGAWMLSYFWAWTLAKNLQIKRKIRYGWAQVGDRLEESFTLINHSRVPALWVEVIGQTNMPNYWANQVRSVKQESQIRWLIRGVCTRRGLYTLGPTTLKTCDPFSIYTVTLHDPASTTLMVMPPVVPLPAIQIAPGGKAGEGSTARVNAPERTVSSASVREYISGDSMRWIHWPTSAKHNELFVRVFEGTPTGDWWILLDLDQAVQIGEAENSTQEQGIILAASLADMGMRTGRSVGLVTYGKELIWQQPQISDEHKWSILRSLALVEMGDVPLAELLELARPSFGRYASLIIITPAIKGGWLESLLVVRRLGVIPTVLVFDPLSFGGTESPLGILNDLSSQGITHKIIHRKLLDHSEVQPQEVGDWNWQFPTRGLGLPSQLPEKITWQEIE
jgi:uncharacterized protein (DUF58 family)